MHTHTQRERGRDSYAALFMHTKESERKVLYTAEYLEHSMPARPGPAEALMLMITTSAFTQIGGDTSARGKRSQYSKNTTRFGDFYSKARDIEPYIQSNHRCTRNGTLARRATQ